MKFSLRKDRDNATSQADARRTVASTELEPNETTRVGVFLFALIMFLLGFAVVFCATLPWLSLATVVAAVAAGFLLATAFRVAPQWEKVAVLRMGKFHRIAGPGFYVVAPFVEYAAIHIDHRTMTSAFSAEAALTADLVPVDVDAIIFWLVWDAKKACLEVANYPKAVLWSAQTALRDAIGQINLADLSLRRKQIDRELLQDALSKEAQAERERNARVILAEVEKDISEMFVEAAQIYDQNPKAMQLRAMNLAYEGTRDGKGVLLAPSSLADSFDVGKLFGKE